jgi:hypothetical protein
MCPRLLVIETDHTFLCSAEAAIALRQRLNETVDQLDALRKEHAELEVQYDSQTRELTITKSDCLCSIQLVLILSNPVLQVNLVNKDQVEILASLRESVSEDKTALEAEMERVKKQMRELNEKNRMQLEQVNVLLLEKVNLQSEGIGQREKMLQRERDFGYALTFFLVGVRLTRGLPAICVLRFQGRMCLKMSKRGCWHFMKIT